jgi:23S rRNA pseudouridine955/2504/2580 synthase
MGQTFKISEHDEGRRIDKIIRKKWPDLPLSAMMRAFRKGMVRVEGRKVECSAHVAGGSTVEVPWEDEVILEERQIPVRGMPGGSDIEVIYADNDVCIVNKPWNLLSQPDSRGGESAISRTAAMLDWKDSSFLPTPVHRLDRNTSGALALALNGTALRTLHEAWRKGGVGKTYLAIVAGQTPLEGEIDSPLHKSGEDNIVQVDPEKGQKALTRFRRVEGDASVSLLSVELLTGRPHQARVHLASIGHPLIGDIKYGDKRINAEMRILGIQRPMLHSRSIEFRGVREPLEHLAGKRFLAVPPGDFMDFLTRRGWRLYNRGV